MSKCRNLARPRTLDTSHLAVGQEIHQWSDSLESESNMKSLLGVSNACACQAICSTLVVVHVTDLVAANQGQPLRPNLATTTEI